MTSVVNNKPRQVASRRAASRRAPWRSLVRKREFQQVYEQGAKKVGRLVVVYLLVPDGEHFAGPANVPDLARAVVASKKVGNAVARNRAKRLLREAFRLGALGAAEDADQVRWMSERFLRGPGGREVTGEGITDKPANQTAMQADALNLFAGLWVVLVARQRILGANSRQVREELDTLLGSEPQPH